LPVVERNEYIFKSYLNQRLYGYPYHVKQIVNKIIQNVNIEDVDFLAGNFSYASNTIELKISKDLVGSISHYMVLAHEVEHLIQKYEVQLKMVNSIADMYLIEFGAVRSEWEFLSLFTREDIQLEIEDIKNAKLFYKDKSDHLNLMSLATSSFSEYRAAHIYNSREAVENYYRNKDIEKQ